MGQGNVFTPVCHSVPRDVWPEQTTPWADTPPGRHPFPLRRHPPGQTPPWPDTPQADTPSVQCMLRYGQQAGGTHPTGMQSCFSLNLKDISCVIYSFYEKRAFRKIKEAKYKIDLDRVPAEENQNFVHHFLNFTTDFW